MITRKLNRFVLLAATIGLLTLAPVVSAGVILDETFTGPAGDAAGHTPDAAMRLSGSDHPGSWADRDTGHTDDTLYLNGDGYLTRVVPGTGESSVGTGQYVLNINPGDVNNATITLELTYTRSSSSNASGTVYFGFANNASGYAGSSQAGPAVALQSVGAPVRLLVPGDTASSSQAQTDNPDTGASKQYASDTHSNVVKLTINTANQHYELSLNGVKTNTGTLDTSNVTPTYEGLWFQFNSANWKIDSIRISNSNAPTVPEPGSVALLGLGGLAFLKRRGKGV